jgi:hypothetical protein
MLELMTGAIVLIVAYSYFREGVLTALTTLINVFIAGLVAFNLYEPLANSLEEKFVGTILDHYEDATSLFILFLATLGGLRWVTNNFAPGEIDLNALAQQVGACALSVLTGYLVAGFLICMLQTLPWGQNFMGFSAQVQNPPVPIRAMLPPDRIWLALMHRAGNGPFSKKPEEAVEGEPIKYHTFDPEGTFELRYEQKRRVKEQDTPAPAQ